MTNVIIGLIILLAPPVLLMLYLFFRGYLFSSLGMFIAIIIAFVKAKDTVVWAFGLGVFPLFVTLVMYVPAGLVVGAIIDIVIHYKKNFRK